jgi:uncharacterized protein involved in exopolysaccharide biosynthesis
MEPGSFQTNEVEVSLIELLGEMVRSKWSCLSIVAITCAVAAAAAWLAPKTYKASVVLLPVSENGGGPFGEGVNALVSQFGGLASLVGISAKDDSKKSESIAVLQSEILTEHYIKDNKLLEVLYFKKWDAPNKRWRSADPDDIPSLWEANSFFKRKVRSVSTETKTGLVTLTIRWKDPLLAAEWANGIVEYANDYLRTKAIDDSERNIAYLNEAAAKTDVVGVKQVIFGLMQAEINREMLARGNEEYAFKVIDPAIPPERPAFPNKPVFIGVGFLVGLVMSLAFAFGRVAQAKPVSAWPTKTSVS